MSKKITCTVLNLSSAPKAISPSPQPISYIEQGLAISQVRVLENLVTHPVQVLHCGFHTLSVAAEASLH